MNSSGEPARQLVRLFSRSYVAFVFSPVVPIVGWLTEIDAMLARSPDFFVGKPEPSALLSKSAASQRGNLSASRSVWRSLVAITAMVTSRAGGARRRARGG